MPILLQKSWAFFKKNWRYFLAIAGTLVAVLLLRRERTSLLEQIKLIQDSHEKELKAIEDAYKNQLKKNEEALALMQKRLVDIQKRYDEAKIELDTRKKKEIEDLLKKHGDDPDALAKKLSEATGFKIVFAE